MKLNLDQVEGLLAHSKRAARAVCTRAGVALESVIELLEARKVKVVVPEPVVEEVVEPVEAKKPRKPRKKKED